MARPLSERSVVPCEACAYHFPPSRMEPRGPGFVCRDKEACRARRAERDRLDAWKKRRPM